MERYPLVILVGPTAVGKTELSLKLAERVQGEIISADSIQVYRKMNIGTAKVSLQEQKRVKHHLIDIINPDEEFSVAQYQEMVDEIIPRIVTRDKLPLLVGGTGLYIKAVVDGFLFPEMENDYQLREELQELARMKGNHYLHQQLKKIDPGLASNLHPNDLRRIIRGLEVYQKTGKTVSYFKKKQVERPERYRTLKLGLTRDREELYNRIDKRVEEMINKGLVEEVQDLLEQGYQFSSTALQGLGYKEIINFLRGDYDLEKAVYLLKRNTRHFAKRQLTWFRRERDIHWFNLSQSNQNDVLKRAELIIKEWR